MINFHNKNLLDIHSLTKEEFLYLVESAIKLKHIKKNNLAHPKIKNKNIALIFEKDSTRTRCSFEVSAYDLGMGATYLGSQGSQIGKKESIKDTARVLKGFYNAIVFRGFAQQSVEDLANYGKIPTYNALTDDWHPTQMLADILTIKEHSNKAIEEIKLVFVGDGRSNTANSLLVTGALLGMDVRILAPNDLQPKDEIQSIAKKLALKSQAKITISDDKNIGMKNADFVYGDVWVSMGEPDSVWAERIKLLKDYKINKELLELSNNKAIKILHCLPAFHNDDTIQGKDLAHKFGLENICEIDDETFESEQSVVFDQAENRMHTIKAVLYETLKD